MDPVFVSILAYVLLQVVFGLWLSRRIETEADYLLAGRNLGPALSTLTIFATWFGAETCVGAAGEAYQHGLSGTTADPFGYALCLLFMGLVFAIPLRNAGIVTLGDLFARRYGRTAERVAVLLLVPTSVMWAAAQIRAFGQVLGATSHFDIDLTISIAAGVVIAYTVAGGLWADAMSDFVQGLVLIAGLVLVTGVLLWDGRDVLMSLPSHRLSLVRADASFLDVLEDWSVPIFGSVVAQELVARVVAARSPGIARRSTLTAAGLYFVVGLMPVLLSLTAFVTVPGLAEPEQVLVHQAEAHLPTVLFVVFVGALISAILSTVDSALLVAGSLVAHNLVLPLAPRLSEAQKVRVNRVGVLVFGLAAYVLALGSDGVYELVEQASAFGSSGVFVCVAFALFGRRGAAPSAVGALLLGAVVYGVGEHSRLYPHPYITSLAAALLGYVLLSPFGTRPEGEAVDTEEAALG